jgi:hypothetical protein
LLKEHLIKKAIERISPHFQQEQWAMPEMELAAAVIQQGFKDIRDKLHADKVCTIDDAYGLEPWCDAIGIDFKSFFETMMRAFDLSARQCLTSTAFSASKQTAIK